MPGNNIPKAIDGIPIKTIEEVTEKEREDLILIASSFLQVQDDIYRLLKQYGFKNVTRVQRHFLSLSIKERVYYNRKYDWNVNVSVPMYWQAPKYESPDLKIYVVTSHFNLHKSNAELPAPKHSTYIQAGAKLTDVKMCDLRDDVGEDNISIKNPFYCELTALYWIYKNETPHDYMGFNLYSRVFAMDDNQLNYVFQNGVDVIVPEPEIHLYLPPGPHKIADYVERALSKVCPSYLKTYEAIRREHFYLPANLFIAKKEIFRDYCKWLFEVLDTYENLLKADCVEIPLRHFGYVAEGLLPTYFLHNSLDMNILFVRRRFLF